MQPFKVYILGCGSALPTLKHNASSQVVLIRDKMFMIDCGEGTQVQLRRSRINFNKLSAIFISHLHGDHCFGLIGLISTLGMLGRISPLHVFAPKDFFSILQQQLDLFCGGLEYEVIFHTVNTASNEVIYEDKSLTVSSIPLSHRIACCGYLFREKPTLPHLRRDMIDFYGIPESQRNNIKNGADWITPDGNVIPNSYLTFPADQPRSYAYCSDTQYMPELYKLIEHADLLYHEATYCSKDENRAKLYYHSTARQAAIVALKAGVKKLVVGHFSARYENEDVILKEAQELFPNTELADEMAVFDV